jgi:hypothetical protein
VPYQINQHVERLSAYQPFDASFGQLYAEYVDTRQSDQLETRAFEFVSAIIHQPEVRVVILTGDAGHGKTHLCGRLVTSNDESVSDPRDALKSKGDGSQPVLRLADGRGLHVIKDLSELELNVASRSLESSLSAAERVTVVCANEGRLRAVLGVEPTTLEPIRAALDGVLERGTTSISGIVHVVDMNHQSVAAVGGRSLVRQLLRSWSSDRRKWSTCGQCDARPDCPIFRNHALLSGDGDEGQSRRVGLEVLLRVVEQTGHVVTIRELLIFMARVLTGGLRCIDVHENSKRHKDGGWQSRYLFHQLAFGEGIPESDRHRLQVFRATYVLDPGKRAIRPVDDSLNLMTADATDKFSPPMSALEHPPRNHQELRRDTLNRTEVYRFLRREAYFEAASLETFPPVSFAERLGLRYYDEFAKVVMEHADPAATVPIRNRVLAGLEAIQGARRSNAAGSFVVVDPAFASHRGAAAVIAKKILAGSVLLIAQSDWWSRKGQRQPNLDQAVDWIDRRLYVLLGTGPGSGDPLAVDLNCLQFDFACRAAQGLTSRSFFQADIRRVMAQLAALAEGAASGDEITVLLNGRTSELVIDVGNVIQATGV